MFNGLRYAIMSKCSTNDERGQGTVEAHKPPRGGSSRGKRDQSVEILMNALSNS